METSYEMTDAPLIGCVWIPAPNLRFSPTDSYRTLKEAVRVSPLEENTKRKDSTARYLTRNMTESEDRRRIACNLLDYQARKLILSIA